MDQPAIIIVKRRTFQTLIMSQIFKVLLRGFADPFAKIITKKNSGFAYIRKVFNASLITLYKIENILKLNPQKENLESETDWHQKEKFKQN